MENIDLDNSSLLSDRLIYTGESDTPTHLHLCTYNAQGEENHSSKNFINISQYLNANKVNWLQVHGMKDTEMIREICNYFKVEFLVVQDILDPNQPTKIEVHDDYTVIIIKLFTRKTADEELEIIELEQQQICIILGKNFVLTFLEEETEFFCGVEKAIKRDVLKIRTRTSDYLLSVLLSGIMSNYITIVNNIEDQLEELEDELLTLSNNQDIGIQIQGLRRQYMTVKKGVMPLKEQFSKLLRSENSLIYRSNKAFYNDVNDHLQFVLQTMEICRETLSSLVDLYISNNDIRRMVKARI